MNSVVKFNIYIFYFKKVAVVFYFQILSERLQIKLVYITYPESERMVIESEMSLGVLKCGKRKGMSHIIF